MSLAHPWLQVLKILFFFVLNHIGNSFYDANKNSQIPLQRSREWTFLFATPYLLTSNKLRWLKPK
jgi:hypothetical protein